MIYLKLGWREARNRPGRALLTLLSIVIGVAAVVAVSFATKSTRAAFDDIYQTIAGKASLEVTATVGTRFDQDLIDTVRAVPGVKAATPLFQQRAVIFTPDDRRIQLQALGIDPEVDAQVHDYELKSGQSLLEADGVMLNENVARNLGIKAGDKIDILTRAKLRRAPVVGLYASKGTTTTGQGGVLLLNLKAAQALFKSPKKIDAIQIVLEPGSDEQAVQADIAKQLPTGVAVQPPAARSSLAQETSLSTEQGLRMAQGFSVLVALFIILNTFLINVTQRRRQLGVMRAIGATRQQIALLICSEALLLGFIGTIIGSVVGVIGAHFLSQAFGRLYKTALPALQLEPMPFILAILLGMGISLIGAALPAWKAAHLSPLDAMREVLAEEIEGVTRWLTILGFVMIFTCLGLMGASIMAWMPMMWSVWWAVLVLVGLSLLLPVALKPLTGFVTAFVPSRLRIEARLARRQLLRHRARTTLTTGVVFVAIATGMGLASAVIDNVQDVKNWYQKTIVADFFVRAMAPDMATGLSADLPDELDKKIRGVPGITNIETVRFVSAKVGDQPIVTICRDFGNSEVDEFDLDPTELVDVRNRLSEGDVVMGSVLAQRTKLKAGDTVSLETDKGNKDFKIAAVVDDYQAGGLTVYLKRNIAERELGIAGVDAYIIHADHARIGDVREALQALVDEYGLLLQSFSDIQNTIDTMMAGVVAGLWAGVAILLVVAAFGVANTLMTTVLEQTRELGLLRILAMTRWQIRNTILAQAMMIGLLALAPGIVAGVGVAYLINLATLPVIGHPVEFVLHPWLMGGGLVGGLIIILAAAWVPAERAARLELPLALRY